jgi:hypothetical protein
LSIHRSGGFEASAINDAPASLAIQSGSAPTTAAVGKAFAMALRARGGIPFYDWSICDGKLPVGLKLHRFAGEIAGTPTEAGASTFTVSLRDYTLMMGHQRMILRV